MKKEECIDCYLCPVCRLEFGYIAGCYKAHTPDLCREQFIHAAQRELKDGIGFWKDGWFDQREATGKMAWEVPNPYYLRQVHSPYFQQQWNRFISFSQQLVRDGLVPLDTPSKRL